MPSRVFVAAIACVVLASTAEAQRPGDCVGDCDDFLTQVVGIDDLVLAVDVVLGKKLLSRCSRLDYNRNGDATVDELIVAVRNSLTGCSIRFPPSPCGDGLIYNYDEEECDDGNTLDGDGCSSDCRLEGAGTLDQWFDQTDCSNFGSFPKPSPWAQEFVPQLPILGGVILGVWYGDVGTVVTILVHRDAIDGEIVGEGHSVILREPTSKLRIDFTPAIAVTPGERYILELEGRIGWDYVDIGTGCAGYEAGSAIASGMSEPTFDFVFRTYGSTE